MNITDIYTSDLVAAYMTEAASNSIAPLGAAYFPDKKKMGIELSWLKTHKGLSVALKPSTFDAIPTVRPRGKVETTREQMPLFRESRDIKETDMMELARIKEKNDPFLQPVIDSIYNDAKELVDSADVATEKMRMQLIAPLNGDMEINIASGDTVYSYDYDTSGTWKGTNYLELTGTDKWDNAAAKPLNDIRKGVQYLASTGTTALTIISNSTTLDMLLENDQIKNALVTMTGASVTFVDEATVEEVIRRRLRLSWISYDKMYKDYDDTEKKFYPDGYITILGGGQLGNTWRGTTPEELTTIGDFLDAPQAPVDISVMENGVAVAVQNVYKPSFTVTTTASQIALPSFEGMDSIFVIKVA